MLVLPPVESNSEISLDGLLSVSDVLHPVFGTLSHLNKEFPPVEHLGNHILFLVVVLHSSNRFRKKTISSLFGQSRRVLDLIFRVTFLTHETLEVLDI